MFRTFCAWFTRSFSAREKKIKTRYAWSRLKLNLFFFVAISVEQNIQIMILDQEYVLRQLFNISTMIGYLNEFCCFLDETKRNTRLDVKQPTTPYQLLHESFLFRRFLSWHLLVLMASLNYKSWTRDCLSPTTIEKRYEIKIAKMNNVKRK